MPYILYVLCELSSRIFVYRVDAAGIASLLQSISALPEDFTGTSIAAAVKMTPDGRTLFASNRGHDSAAVFSAGPDGRLTLMQICPTGGRAPRDITLFQNTHTDGSAAGNFLVAANQDSSRLTVLRFDAAEQKLAPTGQAWDCIGRPVCIQPER